MLLGHKKKQTEEQNWCVVLSPIRNEIDKRKVARKISEVFSISAEEAIDLVANTPIILLDNLTRRAATKVKEYFRASNAEILLTNDVFLKRKCYRTVWPEPPNLSFLLSQEEEDTREDSSEEHVLAPDEALKEIRSLSNGVQNGAPRESRVPRVERTEDPKPGLSEVERDQLLEELNRWRTECVSRREEIERLREVIDRLQKDAAVKANGPVSNSKNGPKENQDFKMLLAQAEERCENLREEYQQTRQLYEEKLTEAEREKEILRGQHEQKIRALEQRLRELETSNRAFEEKITGQEFDRDAMDKERLRESEESQGKYFNLLSDLDQERQTVRSLTEQVERLQREKLALELDIKKIDGHRDQAAILSEDLRKEREQRKDLQLKWTEAEEAKRAFERKMLESQERIQKFENEGIQKIKGYETRLGEAHQELQNWKTQFLELKEKFLSYDKEKEEWESKLKRHEEAQVQWREKYELLERNYDKLVTQHNDEKFLRLKSEEQVKFLSQQNEKLSRELGENNEKLPLMEAKLTDAVKAAQSMEEQLKVRDELLQEKTKLLESKDHELEFARKQVREMNQQVEQRETAQKRVQLSNQLNEKEELFKRLVKEQEKIEAEIRAREEGLRDILRQQEVFEKEIIEIKQSQRHLFEQLNKKEKPARSPRAAHHESEPSNEAPAANPSNNA